MPKSRSARIRKRNLSGLHTHTTLGGNVATTSTVANTTGWVSTSDPERAEAYEQVKNTKIIVKELKEKIDKMEDERKDDNTLTDVVDILRVVIDELRLLREDMKRTTPFVQPHIQPIPQMPKPMPHYPQHQFGVDQFGDNLAGKLGLAETSTGALDAIKLSELSASRGERFHKEPS